MQNLLAEDDIFEILAKTASKKGLLKVRNEYYRMGGTDQDSSSVLARSTK
jgi:hypothetical protein